MSSYKKTMREAREEMLQSLNENNLEKMRKAAGGAKQTLKMKDGSVVMDSFSASAIMQIYDKINDKNKKTFENMMKNGKKADIMKLAKFAMSKVNASYEEFEEEFALDEAKYELYHKDFSSAMQHAYKMAKKLHGITISPDEISDKVATGPRKPSEGKTNKYRLEGDKGGIQIQVYNKGGSKPFELNMYKEEVELDEGTKQVLAHGGKGKYKVTKDGDKIEIKFGGKVVGTADFDRGADSFFVSMKGQKGQKSFDDAQAIADYFAKNKITEDVELDEKLDQDDKPAVNNVVKMLNKASKAHAGQAKDLKKAVETEEAELDEIIGALAKGVGAAAKGAAKVGGAVARKIAPAAKVGAKKVGSAVKKSGAAVRKDFVGGFAVTAGIGLDALVQRYEENQDDYNSILVKAIADRLAEAAAEYLHAEVRQHYWGYATGETLSPEDLIKERYRGIRPAPGYPACPDHTEKETLFGLLRATDNIGITLTETFAMDPAASVSGFYFSHPESNYFGIGKIDQDQVDNYATRKSWSKEIAERWLRPNLSY